MKPKPALILISLLLVSTIAAIEIEVAPYRPGFVMINGYADDREWDYPPVYQGGTENGVVIKVQQDSQFVYIALSDYMPWYPGPDVDTTHSGMDLYIDDAGGNRRMLHVSTALGEKSYVEGEWGEMTWNVNLKWTASLVQSIVEEGKTKFLPPQLYEFQISKKLLPGNWFSMMIHYLGPEKIAPPGASPDSVESWMTFELRRGHP